MALKWLLVNLKSTVCLHNPDCLIETHILLSLICDQEEKARKPERTDPLQWWQVRNLLPSCRPLQGHAASADKAPAWVIWNNPWSVLRLWSTVERKKKSKKVRGMVWELENLRARTICEKHNSWRENMPPGSYWSISRNVELTMSWQYHWGRVLFIFLLKITHIWKLHKCFAAEDILEFCTNGFTFLCCKKHLNYF